MGTSNLNGDLQECIQIAFGRNGELAKAFIQVFMSDFVLPFRKRLQEITFEKLISRKNPYLYRASGIVTVEELVERALGDFISSSTETFFGTAIEHFVMALPNNIKSSAPGVDVERRVGSVVELFAIKSGPGGYNSSSFKTQREHLARTKTILEQQRGITARAYVGFAYGRKSTGRPSAGYTILSSRALWEKLSGDPNFYSKLLDAYACVSEYYQSDLPGVHSRLLDEARTDFTSHNLLDWSKVLTASSG
jgi:hypothetical protein